MNVPMVLYGVTALFQAVFIAVTANRAFSLRFKKWVVIALFAGIFLLNNLVRILPGVPEPIWRYGYYLHLVVGVFVLKGHVMHKLFLFICCFALAAINNSVSIFLAQTFLPEPADTFFTAFCIFSIVIGLLMVFLSARYTRPLCGRLFSLGGGTIWLLYMLGPAACLVLHYPLYGGRMTVPPQPIENWPLFIVQLFIILWSLTILSFAIINTHEKSKQRYEAEFAREVISSGREHYQKMDEMHDRLRTLRHDYKYHLIAIEEYLVDSNKEELRRYLDSMKAELGESEMHSFCDNSVINALLVRYAERCATSEIVFTANIALPDKLTVPNYDLCIVVGNLLENAIEACQKQPSSRKIDVILKPLGKQLALRVKNSFDGQLHEKDGQLKSMKKDGGFGLRSIEAVATRYDGELLLDWEDGIFSAYVTMRL